jgi:hypothetical protein
MKKHIFFLFMLSATWLLESPVANAQSREKRIIAYAQKIHVSSLDSTLPKQLIEVWLKSLVGSKSPLLWEVNDCGEHTGVVGDSSSINPPTCAQVTSKLSDGRTVGIQIIVGTYKTGIKGKPEVFYIYMENHGEVKSTSKLRELPALIGKSQIE